MSFERWQRQACTWFASWVGVRVREEEGRVIKENWKPAKVRYL